MALGRWPVGVSGRDGSLWAERASRGQALCLGHGQPGLRGPAPTLSLGHRAPACETSARAEGRGPTAGPPLPQQATSPLMAPLPQPVTGVHDCMRVHSHGCVRSTRVGSRQTQSASGCRQSARTCVRNTASPFFLAAWCSPGGSVSETAQPRACGKDGHRACVLQPWPWAPACVRVTAAGGVRARPNRRAVFGGTGPCPPPPPRGSCCAAGYLFFFLNPSQFSFCM